MEILQASSPSISQSAAEIEQAFRQKLKLDETENPDSTHIEEQELQSDSESDSAYEEEKEGGGDDEEEEEEFTFVCLGGGGGNSSPITAEEAFHNGQIRPIVPFFNRDLLLSDDPTSLSLKPPPVKNVFVESREEEHEAVKVMPERCKKSNSTGFSKIWRFKDLLHRSNSDGRDTYVFLNNNDNDSGSSNNELRNISGEKIEKVAEMKNRSKKKEKATTSFSAHYKRSRALKEEDKRRSYLPYRTGLVGFFTNVNGGGLSKNVHPY